MLRKFNGIRIDSLGFTMVCPAGMFFFSKGQLEPNIYLAMAKFVK